MPTTTVDEQLQMLANVHRRRVLEYLRRGQRQRASLDELVEHLSGGPAARPDARPRTRIEDPDRVRVLLVQMYLPQLSTHDVVDWDPGLEEVRYRRNEVVERVLDVITEETVHVEN